MKQLYKTRSQFVHGSIENKAGPITGDRLRMDAKFTIVPDQDHTDLFDPCVRLLRTVLQNVELLRLSEV
jgi:hypothetical protein